MERFVGLIVGGGLALVAGSWVVTLFSRPSVAWLAGAALVVQGCLALAVGIHSGLDVTLR